MKLAEAAKPGFDRSVAAGGFSRPLRRDEVQFRGKVIEIVVKIAHERIIEGEGGSG